MLLVNYYFLALFLGILEGLTEFLPISSTAHLRIAQALLGLDLQNEYWKMFSIVIQLGAIVSVIVYFWEKLIFLIKTFPHGKTKTRTILNNPLSLTMVAFAVTAIPAFLLSKIIGKNLESLSVMGYSLVVGGGIMWFVDWYFNKPRIFHIEEMGLREALWIGAVQILSAIFPGTSRSMSTIVAGQLVGLSRTASLEFSFFVSIPVMITATAYELVTTLFGHDLTTTASKPLTMLSHDWILLGIGFITSFLVAWAVIAWFMHWVRNRGFVPFACYRIIVGLCVLLWIF